MALELTEEQKKAGWQVKQLGDVATITMGQSPQGSNVSEQEIGLPLLNGPTEFTAYNPVPVKWTEQITKIAEANDVLFCVRGSTTGRMNIADQRYVIGRGLASIRGVNLADTRFLYFMIQLYLPTLLQGATGSTFPNISGAQLQAFEIAWPPEPERNRIAEILGSVDDKIEANSRLIETLTELVDARVAEAHAQGTESVKISDLAVQSKNQLLPSKATDGLVLHYSLPAFDAGTVPALEEADSIRSSKFVVSRPAVLFSKLNPGTPRIWMVEPDSEKYNFASTEFVVLEPRDGVSLGTLWAACRDPRVSQKLSEFARGTSSSHQRVSPKDILDSSVVVPEIVEEETTLIRRLISENVSLAETRDLLIQKLIG